MTLLTDEEMVEAILTTKMTKAQADALVRRDPKWFRALERKPAFCP